jgi:hypothetical protein
MIGEQVREKKTWGNHCLCEWCCPNRVENMFCICARNLDETIEECSHDTRSRPNTTSVTINCGDDRFLCHNDVHRDIATTAAAQAREKVLKGLYESCECIPLKEFSSDYDRGFHQAMSLVRGWITQSLRSTTPKEQAPHDPNR